MHLVHHALRRLGKELRTTPSPLAYNFPSAFRPPLAALLAFMKLTRPDFAFVQVGANDGIFQDPLAEWIDKFDLHGLLIEPQIEMYESLCTRYRERAGIQVIHAAVAAENGSRPLYRVAPSVAQESWIAGAATFDQDLLLKQLVNYPTLRAAVEAVPVRTMTASTLLSQAGISRVDALIIDVEGYDYNILKLFDVGNTKPAILQYEHRHLSRKDWESSLQLLISSGYLVSHTYEDTLACQEDVFPKGW